MRHALTTSLMIALVALAGCGQATSPAGTLAMKPVAAQPAANSLIATNSGRVMPAPVAAEAPRYEDLETPPPGAVLEADADPLEVSIAAADDGEAPSYRIDERTPYGVVVVERSAKTATIAWRTDVPTKGIIEYGRTWGFDKNGFTDSFRDDVAKTDHRITLTGLKRFSSYTFKVTAVTPLGLKFSDNTNRKFRTKFWSLR